MKNKVKIAIIGSREFFDYDLLEDKINKLIKDYSWSIEEIVSGGAIGCDTLAKQFAEQNKISIKEFKPDYNLGRHAPLLRNDEIVAYSDIIVAFWDGESTGTKYVINKAYKENKEVIVNMYK